MLAIHVEWLHGTLRAGSATDTTLTGHEDPGEWPPSPARIVAAFVAADGTKERCRVTDGSELELLTSAAPPRIIADPGSDVARSPLRERYVVGDSTSKGAVQDYPARSARPVRPGTLLSPRRPTATYVFQDVEADPLTLAALRRRAARISYVGASDHPARVRVHTHVDDPADDRTWHPEGGSTILGVPDPGLLDRLDHAFERFSDGHPVRRSWTATASAAYAEPGARPPARPGQLRWLRLLKSVAPERLLNVTEALRAAVLSHLGDDAPPVLHGHGMEDAGGSSWMQAHYLAFPDVGHRYADGRIHGVAVWLPPEVDESVVDRVTHALLQMSHLQYGPDARVEVEPHDGATGLWATRTARWTGKARRWQSATPVVHERHGKAGLDDVRAWFRHAGLPEPATAELTTVPTLRGAVRLRPSHLRRRYTTPFSHLSVTFDEPVQATVMAVGRGRQFGLGLMVPDHEGSTNDG